MKKNIQALKISIITTSFLILFLTFNFFPAKIVQAFTWVPAINAGLHNWSGVTSSGDGSKLAAVDHGGYIYTSSDSGLTWTARTAAGSRYWYSIASSADGTKLVAVTYGDYIYTSSDSGLTWTARTSAGIRQWTAITSSSDGTMLTATTFGGKIYTSSDSGFTWTERISAGNNYWYSITSSSGGTKLAAVAGNTIYTSINSGSTWTTRTVPGNHQWVSISSSSDGNILTVADYGGYIYTSSDSGLTWVTRALSGSRQWYSVSSSADGSKIIASTIGEFIHTSIDGGLTWTQESGAGIQSNWKSVSISSDGLSFVAGAVGNYIYVVQKETSPIITTASVNSSIIFGTSSPNNLIVKWNSTAAPRQPIDISLLSAVSYDPIQAFVYKNIQPQNDLQTFGMSLAQGSIPDGSYLVQVCAAGSTTNCKRSDSFQFSSAFASVKVISPVKGEVLTKGQTYNIRWQSSGLQTININLFSSTTRNTIASNISASSSPYSWLVPTNLPNGSDYTIAIGKNNVGAETGKFSIVSPVAPKLSIFIAPRIDGRVLTSSEANGCVSSLISPNGSGNTAGCVRSFVDQTPGTYSVVWQGGYPAGADTTKKPTISPTYPQTLGERPAGINPVTFYIDFKSAPVQPPVTTYTANIITRIGSKVLTSAEASGCTANVKKNGVNSAGGCVYTMPNQPAGTSYQVEWLGGYPSGADTTKKPAVSPAYPQTLGERPAGINPATFYIDFQAAAVAAPTATFTIEGQKSYTYTPGMTNHYKWSSTNADTFSSSYTATGGTICGGGPWVANTVSGVSNTYLDDRYVGCTWTVTYTARNSKTGKSASDSVLVKLIAAPTTTPQISLDISNSPSVPSQDIMIGTPDQILGGFDINSAADVTVTKIVLQEYTSLGTWPDVFVKNISLYKHDDTYVSGPFDVVCGISCSDLTITGSIAVPAGKSSFILKGNIGQSFVNGQTVTFWIRGYDFTDKLTGQVKSYPVYSIFGIGLSTMKAVTAPHSLNANSRSGSVASVLDALGGFFSKLYGFGKN